MLLGLGSGRPNSSRTSWILSAHDATPVVVRTVKFDNLFGVQEPAAGGRLVYEPSRGEYAVNTRSVDAVHAGAAGTVSAGAGKWQN